MQSRFVQPALIGGLVIGVLSALPLISAGNVCCCLWVVLGGVAAAYLLQQSQPDPLTAGDGALVGLMAGGFGALVYLVVSIPVTILIAPIERRIFSRFAQAGGEMATEIPTSILIVLGFLFMLFVGPAFGTLGGLLGAALFRKPLPPGPETPIDVPFTSPPQV
jgi:hypothetical protein